MPVWSTIPVTDQPEITLQDWGVFEIKITGQRFFNGWAVENREGRVSSVIENFDPETMRGQTISGRTYQLDGPTGHNDDAHYVLGVWLHGYELSMDDVRWIFEDELLGA